MTGFWFIRRNNFRSGRFVNQKTPGIGSRGRTRTFNITVNSRVLYH